MTNYVNIISQLGVLLGASTGVLRSVHGNGNLICDIIPCDYVVNCIIVAGASTATSLNKSLEVYNCTSSQHLSLTWNGFLDLGRKIYKKYPSTNVLWYPGKFWKISNEDELIFVFLGGRMCSNYYFYLVYFTLFQFLPAILIDIVSVLAGKKTWAIKLQRRIFDSLKVFEYFINNSWIFESKNNQLLYQMINVVERLVTFTGARSLCNYLLLNAYFLQREILLWCEHTRYKSIHW